MRKLNSTDTAILENATLGAMNWCGNRFTLGQARDLFASYMVLDEQRGDFGFTEEGAAAWAQFHPEGEGGYGFVDAATPELTLYVPHSRRRHGLGRRLLRALIAEARTRGVGRMSLSVEDGNPARQLYLSEGFLPVAGMEEDGVMVKIIPDPFRPEPYLTASGLEVLLEFIGQHRQMLLGCLDGLSEEEVRARLVPSKTTLLGLVKHAIFVEKVWFGEARTGTPRAELGIPASPDESFDLEPSDTIASVRAAYRAAVAASEAAVQGVLLDDEWTGNKRGALRIGWILTHVLRELAQHCGHADILREQILAARTQGGHIVVAHEHFPHR